MSAPTPTRPRPLSAGALHDVAFAARHRLSLVLLAVHLPVLAGLALLRPVSDLPVAAGFVGVAAVLLAVGAALPGRRGRALAVSVGLLWSSLALVQLLDGAAAAHVHFLFVLIVLTRYHDWWPLAASLAYVAAAVGMTAGGPFVGYGVATGVSPWWWAAAHLAAVAVAVVVLVWARRPVAAPSVDAGAPDDPELLPTPALVLPPPPPPAGGDAAPSAGDDPSWAGDAASSVVDAATMAAGPAVGATPPRRTRRRRDKRPTTWSLPAPNGGADEADTGGPPRPAAAPPAVSPSEPARDDGAPVAAGPPGDPREPDTADELVEDGTVPEPSMAGARPAAAATAADPAGTRPAADRDGGQRGRSDIKPSMLRDFLGVDGHVS